jgi:hypothetical protein
MIRLRTRSVVVALFVVAPLLSAQQPMKLSALLSGFLADSGVPTRGLPWTTGTALAVKWQSAKPVPAQEWEQRQGFTLTHTGSARVTTGGSGPDPVRIIVSGNATGIQKVFVGYDFGEWSYVGEKGLLAEGFELKPLKCSREKEGASYGNVVYIAKTPGKTASGLWINWDCAGGARGCTVGFTILYRKSDVTQVECAGA